MARRKTPTPSTYTPAIGEAICEHIANGKSLRSWCAITGHPTKKCVLGWLRGNDEFRAIYEQARADQADHFVDEMVEIADKARDPAKARVQIEARRQSAMMMMPKKYGPKLELGGAVRVEQPDVREIAQAMRELKDTI